MTQRTFETFIDEICSKPAKRKHITNPADVFRIDDTWSLEKLDLEDYGLRNIRDYRYVLVVIDNFPKVGWTVLAKKKCSSYNKPFWKQSQVLQEETEFDSKTPWIRICK